MACGWHSGGQTHEDRVPIATGALERRYRGGVTEKGRGICAEAANDAAMNLFDVTDHGKAAGRPLQVWYQQLSAVVNVLIEEQRSSAFTTRQSSSINADPGNWGRKLR
jgi:hypothetical protein